MTCPLKATGLLQKYYHVGFVGLMHIQFCQPTGQGACLLGTIHLSFSYFPWPKVNHGESQFIKTKSSSKSADIYRLEIGKMTNGLLNAWSYTMGQPIRQRMGPGATEPQFTSITIIWLQAVVEIFTNEMVKFRNLLVEQQTKMHNVIYQNHLALDYLTAAEWVCLWKVQS